MVIQLIIPIANAMSISTAASVAAYAICDTLSGRLSQSLHCSFLSNRFFPWPVPESVQPPPI